ncbi:hypothetical protein SAMN05660860_02327 [Geoalkalibacter ferrihydriticus]|uniref:Dipeptidylpeptidase IV N-terminal domain-containing protein n=2 Tax=Geoalkalibacter ferrihydriticus TaxID=392333 RepID=A0A0C2HZ21_9BACT|nr:hypothetical protein [Geoalkalibacter ferrihydriticus]KIH78002.1 hypothetical protein GFER_05230 [Geoalkalibacter ferrihydriticus DSM 17813]SDM33327.1 hypothetical protein SAMN05660860_02327 [Geoalkalibacter ferrihydriticus]
MRRILWAILGAAMLAVLGCGSSSHDSVDFADESGLLPSGLEPTLVSVNSVSTDAVATDGQWLAWTGKDREGISFFDGTQIQDLTRSLPLDHYPQEISFDGRYVAFVSQGKHIFVVDSNSSSPEPVLAASSSNSIESFAVCSGDLVWIDRADYHVYHLALDSTNSSPARITSEEFSRIMVKIDAGVIVWSEYDPRWRVAYYDLSAANPTVVQPAGQTHLDHWQADIHDRLIVWQGSDEGNDVEIFYCDLKQDGTSTVKLTNNLIDDRHPQVHDRLIAWDGRSGGQDTIFYVDMENMGLIHQLPTDAQFDRLSHVKNGLIVWAGSVDGNRQIFYYDLNAPEPTIVQVTNSAYHSHEPLVSDGEIIWRTEEGERSRILAYDLVSEETFEIADLPYSQVSSISGSDGSTVWLSRGANQRIFVQSVEEDLAPFAITPPGLNVSWLEMDDGLVVWQGYDGENHEIYYYDLNAVETEVIKLTDDQQWKEALRISDGIIIWRGQVASGSNHQIYYVDLKSENLSPAAIAVAGEHNSEPQVHGRLITWLGGIWPNYEVYYYDLNESSPQAINLTQNSVWEAGPMVKDGLIAWYRQNTGNINDVWYVDLNAPEPVEVQVTDSSTSDDRVAAVSDGIIAWIATDQTEGPWRQDIYYIDLNEAAPAVVRVTEDGASKGGFAMDAGRMSWHADGEIHLFDVYADNPQVIRLTDNDVSDQRPKIRDGVLIWRSGSATYAARW